MKHAQSVCSQLRNLLVTPQNAQTLVEAVKGAGMGNRHKDAILNAISERLAENLSKTSKQSRPNQAIEDVAPFLTASDVQFREKAEYSLLARVQRVADVYARNLLLESQRTFMRQGHSSAAATFCLPRPCKSPSVLQLPPGLQGPAEDSDKQQNTTDDAGGQLHRA